MKLFKSPKRFFGFEFTCHHAALSYSTIISIDKICIANGINEWFAKCYFMELLDTLALSLLVPALMPYTGNFPVVQSAAVLTWNF